MAFRKLIGNAVDGYVKYLPFMGTIYSAEYVLRCLTQNNQSNPSLVLAKVILWPVYIPFWYYGMYQIYLCGHEKVALNVEFTRDGISWTKH